MPLGRGLPGKSLAQRTLALTERSRFESKLHSALAPSPEVSSLTSQDSNLFINKMQVASITGQLRENGMCWGTRVGEAREAAGVGSGQAVSIR